jgi:uncharacterized membrane protein YczE
MNKLEKRLKLSGILLIIGLLVELVTLHWSHPTAFLFFAGIGGTLMGLGILLYLVALVSSERATE